MISSIPVPKIRLLGIEIEELEGRESQPMRERKIGREGQARGGRQKGEKG